MLKQTSNMYVCSGIVTLWLYKEALQGHYYLCVNRNPGQPQANECKQM